MSYKETEFDPFAGPEIDYVLNTTKAQSEIWSACYFGGDDAVKAYNESITLDFNGPIDATAMDKAVSILMERHEALRATFSTDGTYVTVYKQAIAELSNIDLTNLEENNKEQAVQAYVKEEVNFLFELVQGPLIKFSLLTLSKTNHKLIITAHHIICDGWSIGIMLQDLGELYSAYAENRSPNLIEPISFSAYAKEEATFSSSDEYDATAKFWYDIYKNSVPAVTVPTDYPRPSIRTYKSNRIDFALDTQTLLNLKQTGLSVSASLVSTLLTCFELFLYQLTGQEDLVVGLPYAGQPVTGMNHLMGHCVNLLPLRSKLNLNLSCSDYLKQRKSELFDAYEYPQLSFGHLLQQLNVARDPARIPLVPVAFNIDMGMTDGVNFSNLNYKLLNNPKAYEVFEIFLNASGTEKNLVFEWSYNEALFKSETIEKMMTSFKEIIKAIVTDPSQSLGQLLFQDFTSVNNVISGLNLDYPRSTLHKLFTQRAIRLPNAVAIESNDKKITYGDLSKMTNQMANYFWSQGMRPGQVVAISLDRSPELIATMFAILQCGACYVPMDRNYPDARLNLMIEDSNAAFYIGLNQKNNFSRNIKSLSLVEILNALTDLPIEPLHLDVAHEAAAYIIYTSGSTGKPKGVQVAHCNVINLLYSMEKEPGICETDKIFSVTSISFDAMVMETYLPLIFGACIVLVDEDTRRNGMLLLSKAIKDKITVMWATPSIWQIVLESGWEKPLNIKALVGGEPVQFPLAKALLAKCDSLWNIYGPTETTVCSILTQISNNDIPITIGRPIANTQIYLLNKGAHTVNIGEIGEIAIAGDGVSLGYLNRPKLTNERFIINPFQKDNQSKMYLTGDLGRLLPNGQIQCLGRIDQQVKVRGYRIELGEIEHALLAIAGIKSAVVLAKNDILIAYIVPNFDLINKQDKIRLWREELESQLPLFMVPNVFHILDKIPVTAGDKIDRAALLAYQYNSERITAHVAPRTEEEKIVASIWEKSLNIKQLDIFSNFFEMGGHSIKAVQVMMELQKQTGKEFPLSSLFQYSTVEKFAKLLSSKKEFSSDYLVALKPLGTKTPLFIIHGAGLNILNFSHVINHFDQEQPVYGFQGIGPNGYKDWFESIEDMAATYIQSIIKVNPNGPYAIAGFSFGGIVAFEIARQLKEQGKKVSIIALLDSYVDTSYYYPSALQKKLIRHRDRTQRRLDYSFQMLTSWKAFKIRFNSKKQYLQQKYFGLETVMPEQEADALVKFTEANAMVNKIVDRYHLRPQELEVELFRAEEDESYKLDPTHLGWKKAALNGVNIHNISGNHLDIVAPPNDKILARMLQDLLDERHRQS
jgi:amino acid adenylation domain-containing protein